MIQIGDTFTHKDAKLRRPDHLRVGKIYENGDHTAYDIDDFDDPPFRVFTFPGGIDHPAYADRVKWTKRADATPEPVENDDEGITIFVEPVDTNGHSI